MGRSNVNVRDRKVKLEKKHTKELNIICQEKELARLHDELVTVRKEKELATVGQENKLATVRLGRRTS